MGQPIRGFVLPGDGGRGAYQVGVLMHPRPDGWIRAWQSIAELSVLRERLLQIPQAPWAPFEPALDMLLTQVVWHDYRLLTLQRQQGDHPQLQRLRFVAPERPLPVGTMTTCCRENHERLFRLGEHDVAQVLADVLGCEWRDRGQRYHENWH